jgi:hypothetical protein
MCSRRKFPAGSALFRRPFLMAVGLAFLSTYFALSRPAFAQDQASVDKVVQLNKKAMDDYDTADFDTAKKSLLDAERTGKRAGLETHPVMARTYIHLGALYLVGYKDKQKAQHYFGKALDIQPDIRLDKTLTSASVRDLFAAVKAKKGDSSGDTSSAESLFPPSPGKGAKSGGKAGASGRATAAESAAAQSMPEPSTETTVRRRRLARAVDPDAEPDLPADITALDCPYPDDTSPGKKVTLRCVASASLGVAAVALYYKGFEMTDYERVDMAKSAKGWWQATVAKKRVDGKSLQFYFEGLDSDAKPVVSNGRAESPNVMLIVEHGNQVVAPPAGEEEENPLEEQNRSTPRFRLGKRDEREGIDAHYGNRRFWIGIGAGTGFVYAINGVPEARVKGTLTSQAGSPSTFNMSKDIAISGFGWAELGQLVPTLGFQFNPDWAISVEGRHQWIPQTKTVAKYTASGAHAALLKVIRYSKQQRFRFFGALAGGGGEGVRMTIQTDVDKNPQLKDTIRVGGILFGGAGGINYEISKKFSWMAEVNVLYGAPKQGFAFDINTGIEVNFGDTSGAAEEAAKKKVNSVSTSIDDEEPK